MDFQQKQAKKTSKRKTMDDQGKEQQGRLKK